MIDGAEVMFAQSRKQMIVDIVRESGNVTVNELCDRFSVSPATIRNDLRDLEDRGLLERTHGGAISSRQSSFELNTFQKEDRFVEQKKSIAELAIQQISEGDTIAIDSGTTTMYLAKLLNRFSRLTVVSYDLQITAWLEWNTEVSVIMIGGPIRHKFHCTGGLTALNAIGELHFDKVFLAANGVSFKNGLSTPNIDMANIKAALLRQATVSYLLVDSSKLENDAFAIFAKITDIGTLITDNGASEDFVSKIISNGIRVIQPK